MSLYVWLPCGLRETLPASCNLPTPALHNKSSVDVPSRALLFNDALSWSLTKPQITTLFSLARLVSLTWNKSCTHLESRPKRSSTLSIKPLIVFADFSRWTLVIYKPGKRSSDIAGWSHAFTLCKVLNDYYVFQQAQGRIQGGDRPSLKPTKITFFTMVL